MVGVVSVLDRLAGGGEAIEAAAGAPYVALTTIDDAVPGPPGPLSSRRGLCRKLRSIRATVPRPGTGRALALRKITAE